MPSVALSDGDGAFAEGDGPVEAHPAAKRRAARRASSPEF
jgi:hypothetical protein